MSHLASKFWMVWSPSGHGPTYKHDSRESADTEAKRLARACPSRQFFVLKAMGGFVSVPVPGEPETIEMVTDDIPF